MGRSYQIRINAHTTVSQVQQSHTYNSLTRTTVSHYNRLSRFSATKEKVRVVEGGTTMSPQNELRYFSASINLKRILFWPSFISIYK